MRDEQTPQDVCGEASNKRIQGEMDFGRRLSCSESVYASMQVYPLAGTNKCMQVTKNTNISSR